MIHHQVIVIGAGVAGMQTAQLLGAAGIDVLIIDNSEDFTKVSFHTLGSFMEPESLGLTRAVIAAEINTASLYSKHFKVTKHGKSYIIKKEQVHKELFAKLQANNVEIVANSTVVEVQFDEQGNVTGIRDGHDNIYTADIFVDATGPAGLITKKIGLLDNPLHIAVGLEYNVKYLGDPHEAHLLIGSDIAQGYGWIFPLGENRAILGVGIINPDATMNTKTALDNLLESKFVRKLVEKDNDKTEGGTIPITPVKTKFVKNNVVAVGDSVSQVNPLVGEGYRFILESGMIAAKAIIRSLQAKDLSLLAEYEQDWQQKFASSYYLGRNLQQKAFSITHSDIITDLAVLFVGAKRSKTVTEIMSGNLSRRNIYLP